MPKPSVDKLLEKIPSKYQLVMVVAKRAKQLTDRRERFLREDDTNPVYRAMQEVLDGKVTPAETTDDDDSD